MTNGDGANTAALTLTGDGSKAETLTITFSITAEDSTKVDYTITVNVAAKPAQDANVTLSDDGTEGVKLVGSGNAYTLIIRGAASGVDVSKLGQWIEATGTGSAAISASNTVAKESNTFEITFKGIDGGKDQTITVTARTATNDERVEWDLAAIQAAFPNDGRASISVTNDNKTGSDVLAALKAAVEAEAKWNSGAVAECNFNSGSTWNGDTAQGSSVPLEMHIKVTAGGEIYEADLTVTISVTAGDR